MSRELVPMPAVEMVRDANVPALLGKIRPQWQAKSLIGRVHRLLEVDPSSACQRLFNASIHDLKEKVVIAGIDIAGEAARQNKLPPVTDAEDIENYPTAKLIDLAYRMGLLSRPEWRRVSRCYEIRRDLEHEDDEYEAGVEDCVYIFSTCVEVILSRDPIQLIKVTDFKEIIEQSTSIALEQSLLDDFESAPQPRQEEILKFLISHALNKEISDVIQQNAYTAIQFLQPLAHRAVLVKIGEHMQKKAGRSIDARMARVAEAVGAFAYLRKSARTSFFESVFENMRKVGTHWTAHDQHGELLRSFMEYGGLINCPEETRDKILKWLVLTYLGEPGGTTSYGNVRHVFYSNSAAPRIKQILSDYSHASIKADLEALKKDTDVKRVTSNSHISRRFETLLDIVEHD